MTATDAKQNPEQSPGDRVRLAPGLRLTAEQLALLDLALPADRQILVTQEFRTGYSGAIVVLVSVGAGRAPLVVKLAHPLDLHREYSAYNEFVRQVSPQNIAHLQGEPFISDDGQLGILQYTFAGGESHQPTTSLQEYYQSAGADKTSEVLNRIFRVFGRHWWADNRTQSYVLDEYYDQLLPVHLQADITVADAELDHTIRSGESSVMVITEIECGETIQLVGFTVSKSRDDGKRLTLVAVPPRNQAAAPIRIRVISDNPLGVTPGDTIGPLTVKVTATRSSLLGDAAKKALSGFDPESNILEVPGDKSAMDNLSYSLPNPLQLLSAQLYRVVETKMSIIHGDLNLQNILVDDPTGFAWLIDFAETRVGPTLLDLQRLEVQVITKLMPLHCEIELGEMVDVMNRLHSDPPLPPPENPKLQEPYTLLVTVRQLARQYLIDDLNWNEYYYGLVTALVGSLKYDELDNNTRAVAFVAAAAASDLVGKRMRSSYQAPTLVQPTQVSIEPARSDGTASTGNSGNRRVLGGIGIALALLLVVGIAGWWVAGRSRSDVPSQQASSESTLVSTAVTEASPAVASDTQINPETATNSEIATDPTDSSTASTESAEEDSQTSDATLNETPSTKAMPTVADAVVAADEAAPEVIVAPQIGDERTGEVDNALYLFVPGGSFAMGSDDGLADESPVHSVVVDTFWLMREEVTNAQYQLCVEDAVCTPPASSSWDDPDLQDHPVTHITWEQANQYAGWAQGRLPTEAEWELAARGDDGRAYPWGDDTADNNLLNFNFVIGETTIVGTYPNGAGRFGHLDMAGNVEEWVADRYDASYYAASPAKNPIGPESGPLRVVRGGSYYSNAMDVRAFTREKALPNAHFDSVGFRVAVSAQ